jgi:hypothetical protein
MKQSRLFPPVLLSLTAIVILSVLHFSAAASWNDISSIGNDSYNSLHYWGDNTIESTSDLDKLSAYEIPMPIDSVYLDWNPVEIYRQDLFHGMFMNKILNITPDELLTLQIDSQPITWAQPSEWDNDIQPASEAADHIVFNSNADYIKSVRIPAPTSLLLVALGLISLRYTRSLRL